MRDKVKRFISILMTALMLVNLMPVGALADGITSGGYQQATVASTTYGAWVYVYAKLTGTVPGTTENAHGWYTLGKKWVDNMPDPSGEEMGALYGYGEISGVSVNSVINGMQKYTANENITASAYDSSVSGSGEFGFKICDGATDYVLNNNIKTWHLNLQIDVAKIQGKYTFHFKDQQGNKIKDSVTVTGKWNTEGSYTAPTKINYNGYVYKLTGAATKSYTFNTYQQEHTFYYYNTGERVPYTLKIYYYYESVSDVNLISKDVLSENPYTEDNIKYGGFYSVTSPTIIGYKPDKLVVDGWMPSHDVTVNVIYTRKNDLRYTVKYLETGTNKKLRNAKTVENQPLHKLVTEEAPDIEGYKLVSESPKSITIIEGTNEIIFYYEKDTFTIKYRKGDHAADTFTEQEYTAKYDDPTPTFTGNKDGQPGWKFDGWTPEVAETVKGTATYTAQWVPDTKQNVEVIYTTDGNGKLDKSFDPVTQHVQIVTGKVVKADGSVIGDDLTTVRANAPSAGYEFDHWVKVIDENNLQRIDAGSDLTNAQARPLLNQEDGLYQETVFKAIFRPRTDLSYTVNYYWNGTTTKVADSKTITGQMFGEEVTESPIGADGYTPVSNDPKKITIGTGNNEITFYYYKNVELTANSKTETYDGTQKSVSGFTGAPVDANFSAINVRAKGTNVGKYPANFADGTVDTVDATGKYIVTKATDGQLVITPVTDKVTVTITEKSDTVKYDGNEHTVTGYKSMTADNTLYNVATSVQETPTDAWTAKGTNVGEYPVGIESKDFKNTNANFTNVEFVVVDGALKIDPVTAKVTVTVTGNTASEKYDGTEKTASGYGVSISNEKYTEADFEFKGNAEVKGTDANTYPMGLTAANFTNKSTNFTNVEFVVTDGSLTINKRNVTLTSASDSKVYDGTPLTNDTVTIGGDGFVAGEGAEYNVTGTQTNVGSSDNTFTYTLKKGTKADNYDIKTENGTLTVTPVTDKVTVTITGNTASEKYDGTEKTASGYGVSISNEKYTEADFEFKGNAEVKGTDANTYPMGLTAANFTNKSANFTNVEFVVTDGSLTINKRNVTLTSATDSKVYDGNALTNDKVTVGGDGFAKDEGATYDVTGSQTVVGSSENTFTYTLNGNTKAENYTIETKNGTLTVTDRVEKYVIELEGNDGNKQYDGEALTVNGFKTLTATVNGQKYTVSGLDATAMKTDVNGKTTFNVSGKAVVKDASDNDVTSQFDVTTKPGTLTISKRNVTLTSATDSKVYDGNALTNDKVTVGGDGFVAGEVTEIKATGSVTNVSEGEVTNTITFTKGEKFNEDNYAIEKKEGKLSISKRSVTLTSATLIKDYDGTPLKNGDTPVTETFDTEKAFPDGEGVTYTFTGSQTNAGSSKNMFTYAWNEGTKADNYTICPIEGDLVVTPIDGIKVTITGRKDTQTYDGKPHKVEGYDVKPDNPLFTEKDIEFNGEAEATGTDVRIDQYQMGLKPEQFTNTSNNFTNVEFVVEDGQIVITPRPVTLTSETAGKTYDGTALEKPFVTVGGDGFVEGQVKEIKATGSVTNAGSVANMITFTPNKETFKEGNYAITKTEGTLTIAKRSVLITSQSATKTYDGSALTRPAVTITGDGFVPGELAKAEATGSITKVGSTPNAIQYTTTGAFNAANYSIALSVGTLTVTEKPKPEPRRTFNLTISYVYQNGKRAAASYNRGGLKNGETFDITSPVIAGYTASETVVSGTIYNRDIKVTVIYTADGVNLDDYGVPLGLGNITMNVGDCFE